MNDYGRRIVVDLEFEDALGALSRAVREEGLQTIARIDVRDHFRQDLAHDLRRYFLIEAWSPELALEALRHNLDAGTILPTAFALYELADGETAIVASEPLAPVASDLHWRRDDPTLATVADRESERVARVLERLQHTAWHASAVSPAA